MRLAATVAMAVILGAWMCRAADPEVTNVRAAQRPGTGLVDITYDVADADTATLWVTAAVSTNGGAAFFTPASGMNGDVGSVARGAGKAILWNAGTALPPKLYHNVKAQVTASDGAPPAPPGMVLIPGGTNSGTDPDFGAYSLTVETFYMDSTEVTKAKWDEVAIWATANGYDFDNDLSGEGSHGQGKAPNHPVHTVNWHDCVKWCNARSQKEGRTPCYTVGGTTYKIGREYLPDCNFAVNGYRLPTDSEWQYAARGGLSGMRFPWGDMIAHSQANYLSNADFSYDISPTRNYHPTFATGGFPYTSPVGSFAANEYGLYDMAGNVSEWCNDMGTTTGSSRLMHGGNFDSYARYGRCGHSLWTVPHYCYNFYGFRTVCR